MHCRGADDVVTSIERRCSTTRFAEHERELNAARIRQRRDADALHNNDHSSPQACSIWLFPLRRYVGLILSMAAIGSGTGY